MLPISITTTTIVRSNISLILGLLIYLTITNGIGINVVLQMGVNILLWIWREIM